MSCVCQWKVMFGLRGKLLLGFGGLLLAVIAVSLISERVMDDYGRAVQRSYREDYESVAACQDMKASIEQMDLAAQTALWDRPVEANAVLGARSTFEARLAAQRQEATLPGEAAATEQLAADWSDYLRAYPAAVDRALSLDRRRTAYLNEILPRSRQVLAQCQRLIDMNMSSILSVPGRVQQSAARAHWAMRSLAAGALLLTLLFLALIGRIILTPIRSLTRSVHEVERGNFDLAAPVRATDELGRLANAFNTMAGRLRDYLQAERDRLVRTERTTQLAIDSLPDPVLAIDPAGKIELANEAAHRLLGVRPGDDVRQQQLRGLGGAWEQRARQLGPIDPAGYAGTVQFDVNGETRHYLPRSTPIADSAHPTMGTTVVLADVTELRRLDEMKNSLLSLVSHELKTPLTAARMVLHLVTERRVGPLSDKQHELLSAARDDTDRLHRIVENLLDMGRIESGRALMELEPVAPRQLISQSIAPLADSFSSQGVALVVEPINDALPPVAADAVRIGHVFANLLMNALRHTPAGGEVRVGARPSSAEMVEFWVRDTGCGIPRVHLHRVFDKFFRVPGQPAGTGSGLGLAFAKDLVEAHGGQIYAESSEGAGCTIYFKLRVANHT